MSQALRRDSSPLPSPARPGSSSRHVLPRDHFYKAAFVKAHAFATKRTESGALESLYPNDRPTEIVLRASSNPAATNVQGWAAELAASAVADAVVGLAPASASAELIALGLSANLPVGAGQVVIPGMVVSAGDAGAFVAEGAPIPVKKGNIAAGPLLNLRKLAVISTFSRELAEHSEFEGVIRQIVGEALGLALDAKVFPTNADDGVTPGGILNGVSPGTAATGGGANAFSKDVGTLVAALTTGGGGRSPVFVAAPGTAASMKTYAGPRFDFPILASSALSAGTVVAVEASAFVAVLSPAPEFSVSREAVLHMEDTSPAQIGFGGSLAGGTTQSLFQTDTLGLRTILRVNWAMRASGNVALLNSVTW
jgi:Phage capsid family